MKRTDFGKTLFAFMAVAWKKVRHPEHPKRKPAYPESIQLQFYYKVGKRNLPFILSIEQKQWLNSLAASAPRCHCGYCRGKRHMTQSKEGWRCRATNCLMKTPECK